MLDAGWAADDHAQMRRTCTSHSGEERHIDVGRPILASAGLGVHALQNTPALPLDSDTARALMLAGGGKDALHQSCSGKHAAMLATCAANGWPTSTYLDPDHPLQRAIRATVEQLTGEPVVATAVDGCGAPLFATSLVGFARAFATLG